MKDKVLICPYEECEDCFARYFKKYCRALQFACTSKDGSLKRPCPFYKTEDDLEKQKLRISRIKYPDKLQKELDDINAYFRKKKEEEERKKKENVDNCKEKI